MEPIFLLTSDWSFARPRAIRTVSAQPNTVTSFIKRTVWRTIAGSDGGLIVRAKALKE
jgi:hypothetical protein